MTQKHLSVKTQQKATLVLCQYQSLAYIRRLFIPVHPNSQNLLPAIKLHILTVHIITSISLCHFTQHQFRTAFNLIDH